MIRWHRKGFRRYWRSISVGVRLLGGWHDVDVFAYHCALCGTWRRHEIRS